MAPAISTTAWDGIRLEEDDLSVTKINDKDANDWRLEISDDRHGGALNIFGHERIKVLQRAINGLFPEEV